MPVQRMVALLFVWISGICTAFVLPRQTCEPLELGINTPNDDLLIPQSYSIVFVLDVIPLASGWKIWKYVKMQDFAWFEK